MRWCQPKALLLSWRFSRTLPAGTTRPPSHRQKPWLGWVCRPLLPSHLWSAAIHHYVCSQLPDTTMSRVCCQIPWCLWSSTGHHGVYVLLLDASMIYCQFPQCLQSVARHHHKRLQSVARRSWCWHPQPCCCRPWPTTQGPYRPSYPSQELHGGHEKGLTISFPQAPQEAGALRQPFGHRQCHPSCLHPSSVPITSLPIHKDV